MYPESLRYTKGLGGAEVYAVLEYGLGFWDFANEQESATETADCRVFLAELPDLDPDTAYYYASLDIPLGGPFPVKIKLLSTGDLIGTDLVFGSDSTSAPSPASGTSIIVQRLLRAALKSLGVVDSHDAIDPVEYDDALESCNMMLKLCATKGLIVHHVITESFALAAGPSAYTIGPGGALDTSRPNRLAAAYLRDTNGTDYPLELISRDDWNRIPRKGVDGVPTSVYINPTFPLATLNLDYAPTAAYTLFLDSLKPLAELALENSLNLPPEYEEAIKYNLAVRLAPDYRVQAPPEVVALADNAYKALTIQPVPAATFDGVPGVSSRRDTIYNG